MEFCRRGGLTEAVPIWGAGQCQHGIDFVNSTKMEFHVWALEYVNAGFETTYEEQNLTPD